MAKPMPCLWFDTQAEDAAKHYVKIFGGKMLSISRYGKTGPGPAGTVMTAKFRLKGQDFLALNGGPQFRFTEAISFIITCNTQREIDKYWDALTAGGQPSQCGWLKDKFGLSWQVVPAVLPQLLTDKDPNRRQRAMQAMMQMKKFDIAALRRAARG